MVNFRYHLVSLIAVFLALAVGVFLGAGPLQNSITSALSGRGDARTIEQLQQSVLSYQEQIEIQDDFISELAQTNLSGTLDGVNVATVSLGSISEDTLSQISEYVTLAGGTVVANVELSESWTSITDRTYRETLATPLTVHLSSDPVNSTSGGILAEALFEVLTISSSETSLLREILVDPQMPLVQEETLPNELVDAIILLGAEEEDSTTSSSDSQSGASYSQSDIEVVQPLWVVLADTMAKAENGAVAFGEASEETDFITVIRGGETKITTVDSIGTETGIYNAVAALSVSDGGAYGAGTGAMNTIVSLE